MRSLSKSSCLSRLKEAYRLSPLARHDPAKEYSGRNVPTRQGRICTTHFTDRYQTAVGVVHIQSGFLIRRYAPDSQPAFGERGFQFRPTAFRLDRLDSRRCEIASVMRRKQRPKATVGQAARNAEYLFLNRPHAPALRHTLQSRPRRMPARSQCRPL